MSIWQAFLSCFTASANKVIFPAQCKHFYTLQCQKLQTTPKLSNKSRNKRSNPYDGVLRDVRAYTVTVSYRRST